MCPMSEFDYSKSEMVGYYSQVSAYFQKEAESIHNSRIRELQKNKEKYVSLMASDSREDRLAAREMLKEDLLDRLGEWAIQTAADHLDPHKHTLPGSELVTYLLIHNDYSHIKSRAENKDYSQYRSPIEHAEDQSLAKAFGACISDMNRKYPAGSQVAKATEWVLDGGLVNVAAAVVK